MYLRLPMIVGQAGLIAAIGIIVVAHIISLTTGLSVSSIATDKKVKAGGTYVPIDPDYPEKRILHTLQDSQSIALITTTDHLKKYL